MFGWYLPFAFLCPLFDMINHNHTNDCGIHIISKQLHSDPKKFSGYYLPDKYLCDVTLVTGIGATDKLNNVYKGFSKVEQTLPQRGNLA